MDSKYPMTAAGHAKLEAELKALKHEERPAVIKAIAEAREHGDLSENAEYAAAREKQSFIEGRILELEAVLAHAEIFNPKELIGDTIRFGATVDLIDDETDKKVRYQIVGEYEANLEQGLIANTAPIARALFGKIAGDTAEVITPKGTRYYEVVAVHYL